LLTNLQKGINVFHHEGFCNISKLLEKAQAICVAIPLYISRSQNRWSSTRALTRLPHICNITPMPTAWIRVANGRNVNQRTLVFGGQTFGSLNKKPK